MVQAHVGLTRKPKLLTASGTPYDLSLVPGVVQSHGANSWCSSGPSLIGSFVLSAVCPPSPPFSLCGTKHLEKQIH